MDGGMDGRTDGWRDIVLAFKSSSPISEGVVLDLRSAQRGAIRQVS